MRACQLYVRTWLFVRMCWWTRSFMYVCFISACVRKSAVTFVISSRSQYTFHFPLGGLIQEETMIWILKYSPAKAYWRKDEKPREHQYDDDVYWFFPFLDWSNEMLRHLLRLCGHAIIPEESWWIRYKPWRRWKVYAFDWLQGNVCDLPFRIRIVTTQIIHIYIMRTTGMV